MLCYLQKDEKTTNILKRNRIGIKNKCLLTAHYFVQNSCELVLMWTGVNILWNILCLKFITSCLVPVFLFLPYLETLIIYNKTSHDLNCAYYANLVKMYNGNCWIPLLCVSSCTDCAWLYRSNYWIRYPYLQISVVKLSVLFTPC